MRKWITFLMTFLASVSCANAYVDDGQVLFEAGYRHDNLSFTAKAPSDDPIFRASEKFKDLDIVQIGVEAKGNVGCNVYLRGSADWGWILDGNTEKKFEIFNSPVVVAGSGIGYDTATNITRVHNILDGRYVFDVSAALGYPFYFCNCSMSLSPVVGYSFNEQNLWIENNENFNVESVNGAFVPVGEGGCCGNKFIARWYGPFVGLDWVYYPCGECWNLYAELEFHWAHAQVKRHNGSGFGGFDEMKSTSRNAHGWVFEVGANYDLHNCWTVGLNVKFQDFGASRSHHDDCGGFDSYSDNSSRLRTNVHWNSYAVNFTFGREF